MPAFGPSPGQPDPAQPMIDWILGAPPAELAPEIMGAFGPDAPRWVPWVAIPDLEEWMFRVYPKRSGLILTARPVQEPIFEAVQLLEHSELVYVRTVYDNEVRWSATRLGLATLSVGKAALRKRIKDRTGV